MKLRDVREILTGFSAVFTSVILFSNAAQADSVADLYRGKTVTIQVGFAAGGGYDLITRLVARHMHKHIPGNPAVSVSNMPGAGSIVMASYMYNVAPKDGSMLGMGAASVMLEPLYGNKNAKYDPDKFEWIGSMNTESHACAIWKGAGIGAKTLDDLIKSKKTITFGSPSPETENTRIPMFLKHIAGAPFKVVHGYPGTKPIMLAAQRGEVDATCGMAESSVKSAYKSEFESGDLKVIFHVNLERDSIDAFGDAAGIRQFLKTDEMKAVGEIMFRTAAITRPLMAPPGTPKEVVAALRKALTDTMNDPATIADGKQLDIDFEPITGEKLAQIMSSFQDTPRALIEKALELGKAD